MPLVLFSSSCLLCVELVFDKRSFGGLLSRCCFIHVSWVNYDAYYCSLNFLSSLPGYDPPARRVSIFITSFMPSVAEFVT
jgi:hypothetical protein